MEGREIRRRFVIDGFASVVDSVVWIDFDAERPITNPDILISNYKKVTPTFSTYSRGALAGRDFTAALASIGVCAG